jgi:hypothetical protein
VDILTGVYVTGKKCAKNFLEKMGLTLVTILPHWNYRVVPQISDIGDLFLANPQEL